MLIWVRWLAQVWVDASARTIFKVLSSNTDKVEQGRKLSRRRNNNKRARLKHHRNSNNKLRRHSKRNSLLRRSVRLRRKFRLCRVKASP